MILWTVAHWAPLSMEFPRQEYWSGLPCPTPGGLPDPGIKPRSPELQVDSLLSEPAGKPHCKGNSLQFSPWGWLVLMFSKDLHQAVRVQGLSNQDTICPLGTAISK